MNFLELCKRARAESGISGEGPSNVSGQVGMYAKIVQWVKQAYNDIQLLEAQWRFDWASTQQTLNPNEQSYSPKDDWGLAVKQWIQDGAYIYRPADGDTVRHWPTWIDWRSFKRMEMPNVKGIPTYWTEGPDKKIYFYPIPDQPLTFLGEYYETPQELNENNDVPRLPEEYHMAIVWRAVMYCANDIEDAARYVVAKETFLNFMMKIRTTELMAPVAPEPLA